MLNRYLSLTFAALLLNAACAGPVFASLPAGKDLTPAEKVREKIAKRGVGERSRVTVRLRDGTQAKGYISQAGDESFTLTDRKTGQARTLSYAEVSGVKGQGLSAGAKWGIGLAVAAGALAVLFAVGKAQCDGFC